ATVRYTTDGSDPTADSPVYQRPFAVTQTLTVKARAFKVASLASPVATATLTMVAANVSGAPTIAPAGGQYTTPPTITITGPAGATLHYTTTGEDPSDTDPVIASGATLTVDRSMVVKVRAWQAGMGPSAVRREDYVITGAISAGQTFSIALKADGTVWTWGYDWYGQLGDGGAGIRTAPFQVLSGAVAVSGGNDYALALKSDGTVWSGGNNAWGALGDGTYTTRRSPIQVLGLSEVIAIAAGDGDSYALKSDGTVWAWGSNIYGQLGDGTLTWHAAPIKIPGLSGVSAIAA